MRCCNGSVEDLGNGVSAGAGVIKVHNQHADIWWRACARLGTEEVYLHLHGSPIQLLQFACSVVAPPGTFTLSKQPAIVTVRYTKQASAINCCMLQRAESQNALDMCSMLPVDFRTAIVGNMLDLPMAWRPQNTRRCSGKSLDSSIVFGEVESITLLKVGLAEACMPGDQHEALSPRSKSAHMPRTCFP